MAEDDKHSDLEKEAELLKQQVVNAQQTIFQRDLTPTEFYYLLSRYPYLEICNVDYPYIDNATIPIIHTADNGWKIYDYGSVLATGCYELIGYLYGREKAQQASKDEGGEGGNGTIIQQYSDVAFAIINMAIDKGWAAAEIISGFYPMQRMAWIAAKMKGYELKGFTSSVEDHVVSRWVSRLKQGELYPPATPIKINKKENFGSY